MLLDTVGTGLYQVFSLVDTGGSGRYEYFRLLILVVLGYI